MVTVNITQQLTAVLLPEAISYVTTYCTLLQNGRTTWTSCAQMSAH
jgi:hypothetical protein